MPEGPRRAIVVGASSGIGAALAVRLALDGAAVAAVARRGAELEALAESVNRGGGTGRIRPYVHDVRNYSEAAALLERIASDLGGLDAVVYASGVMPRITPDEYSFEKDREIVEVNLLGAMAWLDPAAERFEKAGTGVLCGISSVAGERGRRGNPAYCASKAALTTYLESLRNRLTRHGVGVVTVKPGYVDTAMTRGMEKLFWVISADKAAAATAKALRRRRGVRFVPRRWGLVAFVLRRIPSFVMTKLDI